MAKLADTLTTRDAVRRATGDDIIGRAQAASKAIEGGELDGIEVVTMGTLREVVSASLRVKLPPPSERHAEVSTPATIVTSALCPECGLPVIIDVRLTPQLQVDDTGAEIAVKAKSKARAHQHNQLSLPEGDDSEQLELGDVVIDDLRLRIVSAVYDLEVEHDEATDRGETGQPITLDAIAVKLEIASESDRGDLEESLYAYSQLEVALVDVVSETGSPVTYALTDDGTIMVDQARTEAGNDADVADGQPDVDDADPDDAP